MKLEDDQRQKMDAVDVFSAGIRFFKEHLMERLKLRVSDIMDTEIRWVLTVPAIWEDASKQFMTKAAIQVL